MQAAAAQGMEDGRAVPAPAEGGSGAPPSHTPQAQQTPPLPSPPVTDLVAPPPLEAAEALAKLTVDGVAAAASTAATAPAAASVAADEPEAAAADAADAASTAEPSPAAATAAAAAATAAAADALSSLQEPESAAAIVAADAAPPLPAIAEPAADVAEAVAAPDADELAAVAALAAAAPPAPGLAAPAPPPPPQLPPGAPAQPPPVAPTPKQLTASIRSTNHLARLVKLVEEHAGDLNAIHVAALITKLPKLEGAPGGHVGPGADAPGRGAPWPPPPRAATPGRTLLAGLLARLQSDDISEYSSRGLANIIWALAKLQHYPSEPLRARLLDTFVARLPDAVPQDVSNVLWGVAKLTKERSLLAAAAGGRSSSGGGGGGRKSASGSPKAVADAVAGAMAAAAAAAGARRASGDAAAAGAAAAPALDAAALAAAVAPAGPLEPARPLLSLEQVQRLLAHLCTDLPGAQVQTISNSLWAAVIMQQEHGWCMCGCLVQVQLLLHGMCQQSREALPGHIQPVVRSMVQLAMGCAPHSGDAWVGWQPPVVRRLLGVLFSMRAFMEQHQVLGVLRDLALLACLVMLTQRRRDEAAAAAAGRALPGAMSADEMLRSLAAPSAWASSDAASTVLALGMLRPQLAEAGLLASVQHLCGRLSVANQKQVHARCSGLCGCVRACACLACLLLRLLGLGHAA